MFGRNNDTAAALKAIHDAKMATEAIEAKTAQMEQEAKERARKYEMESLLSNRLDIVNEEIEQEIIKNNYYKELLAKPLSSIIDENLKYKQAYEEQQKVMQMWILQQKSFQDLSFELGKKNNINMGEVWDLSVQKMEKASDRENPDNLNGNISEKEQKTFYQNNYYYYLKQAVEKLKRK